MKIVLLIVGIVSIAFVAVQLYAMNEQKKIEKYAYSVKKKYDEFEIRDYEASLFTSVELKTPRYDDASEKGFSILANYIFGGNEENEKIAMTSPVAMSLEDTTTMMFMVPKKYSKETLPEPNESKVKFREEPAKTVAAITFGGWANDEKIKKYEYILKKALEMEGIAFTNKSYFLGYNAPYEVLNRKNEIIIELKNENFLSSNEQ